jgi:hypothetical protein
MRPLEAVRPQVIVKLGISPHTELRTERSSAAALTGTATGDAYPGLDSVFWR